MADASFYARAIAIEFTYEGGKVDNPKDPGGRTNMGVTQVVYNGWRRLNNLPVQDVFRATPDEARAIFKAQYADAVKFDQLRPGIDLVMLDGAINSGPKQAIKWAQAALKRIGLYDGSVDGVLGAASLTALSSVNDDDALIDLILQFRMGMLKALKTWKAFGKGWSKRIANLKRIAQAWAMGTIEPAAVSVAVDGGHQKAPPPAVDGPNGSTGSGINTAGAGLGGAIATQTIGQIKDQLTPFQGVHAVDIAVQILTIATVAIAIGGIAYAAYWKLKTKKAIAANDATLMAPVPA